MNPGEQPVIPSFRTTSAAAPNLASSQCWSQRGVFGDGSCAELAEFVHCRNCPVYSATALSVLERPLPCGYREDWTRQVALPRKARELSTGSVVLFRIQTDWLALPTRCFQEIADRRPIHSLPHQRKFVLGLANVRGELLLCVSLGHFLGLASLPERRTLRTNYSRLVVVNWNSSRICFPAQEVRGPRRFSQEDLKPVPTTVPRGSAGLTSRILRCEQDTVGLLEPNLLCTALVRSLA